MSAPQLSRSRADGTIVVKHREFLQDIVGTAAFTAVKVAINPGLTNSFPWLSKIARNYESYRFRKVDFEYDTMVSTDTDGAAMLVMDYDAADSAPTTKLEAMSFLGSERGPLWQPTTFRANVGALNKLPQRYVRFAALASNLDVKTYDAGSFYMCTVGSSNTGIIGELYVDYEVELITPQYQIAAVETPVTGAYFSTNPGSSSVNFFASPDSTGVTQFGSQIVNGYSVPHGDPALKVNATEIGFREIGRYVLSGFFNPRTTSAITGFADSGFSSLAGITLNGGKMSYNSATPNSVMQWLLDLTVNRPNSTLNMILPEIAQVGASNVWRNFLVTKGASTMGAISPVLVAGTLQSSNSESWVLHAEEIAEPALTRSSNSVSPHLLMSHYRDPYTPN